MTVADYAKFLECLLHGGSAADGSEVLSTAAVDALLRGRFDGLDYDAGTGPALALSGDPGGTAFTYGWASAPAESAGAPKQNYWSGYAGTHFRLFADDDAYVILAVQCMDHANTGSLRERLTAPVVATFLEHWATAPAT
jgi:CubicO group peptidase (beta-lactamase class C family)